MDFYLRSRQTGTQPLTGEQQASGRARVIVVLVDCPLAAHRGPVCPAAA